MKIRAVVLVMLASGCASTQTRPQPVRRNDTTAVVKDFKAAPGTSVTWFIGAFSCGIDVVSVGRSQVRDDGTFTVWWNAERAKYSAMQLRAFVDTNDDWHCDNEAVFITHVDELRQADFSAGTQEPHGCMVLNVALH